MTAPKALWSPCVVHGSFGDYEAGFLPERDESSGRYHRESIWNRLLK